RQRVKAVPADQGRDDLRVDYGAPGRDAADGADEVVDVEDAVLEQVTDALGLFGEQLHGVRRLDVLREDEDATRGVARPDLARRPQSFVGERRWHRNVHDRQIRLVGADLEQQIVDIGALADHDEALILEERRKAFAQEERVLGDHDPQGPAGVLFTAVFRV